MIYFNMMMLMNHAHALAWKGIPAQNPHAPDVNIGPATYFI
jgi:hypothetical protein